MTDSGGKERHVQDVSSIYASPLHAPYITRQEAADLLRVSPATVDQYYHMGLLDKYKVDGGGALQGRGSSRALFLREEVLSMIKKCPPPAKIRTRRKFDGRGLAERPELMEARSQDEVQRAALKRFDEERKNR